MGADWFGVDSDPGQCYKIHVEGEVFENAYYARNACIAEGADLASIPSNQTMEDICARINTYEIDNGVRTEIMFYVRHVL